MSRLKPTIIFLMEVKNNRNMMEKIKLMLHFEGLFYVKGANRGGRLALVMERERFYTRLLSYSNNHIDISVQLHESPV